jgi:alkylation response protein AidB-like acyl-CoA dehydrogenase
VDFSLNEDQRVLRDSVREFCAREIIPRARGWDESERFPHEIVPKLAEMGLWGMRVPEAWGGAGMSMLDCVIALEEIARADGSIALTVASHNALCSGHILHAGTSAQKEKYLPLLASGQMLGAWGLTEPGSGSDAGSARTRAVRRGDRWNIRGTKTFITQGSVAGVYVVLASTSPDKKQHGLTAFIVEKGTPGLQTGRHIEKMGCRASDTTELVFSDCEVGDQQRLGEVDAGFKDTLQILDKGRIGIATMAVGLGRGAIEESVRYAKQRHQFGGPIAEFQAIQFMLANMATEIEAARLLCWRAAWLEDQGRPHARESSICKLWAAQVSSRACNLAIQIHGGYGYTREFPVERYFRDTRLCEIGEGTNEVQRLILARELGRMHD